MPITLIGSSGLGLVWGWLIGNHSVGSRRHLLNGLALGAATLLLAAEVILLVDWRALTLFLTATILALVFHIQWRRELHKRFELPNS